MAANDSLEEGLDIAAPPSTNITAQFALAIKCLDFFNLYYVATIIIFGTVGNILNFLVFTRTHFRLRSSSYYLAALALADLGFLLTLLIVWLNHVGIDLFNRQGFCQALVFTSSVCSCLSVWLTVAFTFERLIAVHYPLQRSYMCTVRRAKIIISVLTVTTVLSHTYSLFTAGISAFDEKTVCDLLPDYHDFMRVINVVDTIITLVIPFILIVVMNTLIARSLFVFSRTFKKAPAGSSRQFIQMRTIRIHENGKYRTEHDSGQGSGSNPSAEPTGQKETCLQINNALSTANGQQQPNEVQSPQPSTSSDIRGHRHLLSVGSTTPSTTRVTINKKNVTHQETVGATAEANERLQNRNILSIRIQYSITKMLLLISTVFIMLNLPSYVVRLQVFVTDVMATGSEVSATAWLMQQFFMLLYYTNFSINFLLYSTCGGTFRHCLCRLIRNKIDAVRRSFRAMRHRSSLAVSASFRHRSAPASQQP